MGLVSGCAVGQESQIQTPYRATAGVFAPGGGGGRQEGTGDALAPGSGSSDRLSPPSGSPAAAVPDGGVAAAQGGDAPATDQVDYFDSENPARNQVSAGGVCGRIAALQCAAEALCCSNTTRSFDQCQASVQAACAQQVFLDQITASPLTGFDASRAEAVLADFETQAKACSLAVASWAVSLDGLLGIMQGTLSRGDSCRPSNNERNDPAQVAPYLLACADSANTACLPTSIFTWRCSDRGGARDSCLTDLNCQDGFYCPQDDYAAPEIDSECEQRLADGEPCKAANECASLTCQMGRCAPATADSVYCLP